MPGERLQKILARHGLGSRRSVEALIREGRVRVDGAVAELGRRADPAASLVTVDGAPLPPLPPDRTLLLHKPRGVLVTASDERGRETVFDLLDNPPASLRHVGRLDLDSEGLLLLTTNGELAHRLTHPRYRVDKTYEALVEGVPDASALDRLREGVELDDGPTAPAEAELLRRDGDGSWLRVVLHEGRKRQLRRMLDAVGHPVRRLIRRSVGGLDLGGLAPGAARPLDAAEERALLAVVGLLDAPEEASISSPGTRAADASMATGGGAGTEPGAIAAERAQPQSPPPSPAQGEFASESVARSLALDGPTASGKSAVGRALAERLGFGFLDTGMMYRACTRAVFDAGIDPGDGAAVIARVRSASLDVTWPAPATPRVSVDGADVTDGLREPAIEASVSLISRLPEVRDEMVRHQRAVAERSPVVMAGRDIGTRVLTDARTKIFLAASIEVRARRRLAEELAAGRETDLERVTEETARRDGLDQTGERAIHPEQAAEDAIILDTDALGIDEVVARALAAYERANAS